MRNKRFALPMGSPTLFATAIVIAIVTATVPAQAQGASGDLRCRVAGGLGFLVGAKRAVTCVYYRRDGATEFYTGSTSRIGVDLGATSPVRIAYRVAGVDPVMPAVLEGAFGGPGLSVTLGAGVGADVLMGGRTGSVALVPIGNTSITGIDVSAGLSVLTLHYVGVETERERRRGY